MHYVERCEHGTVVSQCRCPGPKSIRIVACPKNCPIYREGVVEAE